MPKPANSLIVLSDGVPWIRGYRCPDCGAVATAPTLACRRCLSRHAPQPFRATRTGRLITWSVVERSFPGIEVPFITAIVELDDGLTLKGTLYGSDCGATTQGMAVELIFDDARGARDKAGETYIGYHFIALKAEIQRRDAPV